MIRFGTKDGRDAVYRVRIGMAGGWDMTLRGNDVEGLVSALENGERVARIVTDNGGGTIIVNCRNVAFLQLSEETGGGES